MVSFSCWMKYPGVLDAIFHHFLCIASLPWFYLCFLFAGSLREKKKKKGQTTISVYCTLGVCILLAQSFECFHRSNRAAPCLCPALFRLLDTGLMLVIGLLDAVLQAHMCSMVWISIMNPGLFLLKNECGILVAFKQGLVSESSVWTAELGCFLSS